MSGRACPASPTVRERSVNRLERRCAPDDRVNPDTLVESCEPASVAHGKAQKVNVCDLAVSLERIQSEAPSVQKTHAVGEIPVRGMREDLAEQGEKSSTPVGGPRVS